MLIWEKIYLHKTIIKGGILGYNLFFLQARLNGIIKSYNVFFCLFNIFIILWTQPFRLIGWSLLTPNGLGTKI